MQTKRWIAASMLTVALAGIGLFCLNHWPGSMGAGKDDETASSAESIFASRQGFVFPADRGGKLLSQILPPSEAVGSLRASDGAEPRRFGDVSRMMTLPTALPPLEPDMPYATLKSTGRGLEPHLLPEEAPLSRFVMDPVLPQIVELPASRGVRLPSVPVDQVPTLSFLAQGLADRASLDDPTAEYSVAAALAAPLPDRSMPAPFVRLSLADPFENYAVASSKNLHVEDSIPVIVVRLPGR
jgi:hypothetical protein